jgi:hypothetical protein
MARICQSIDAMTSVGAVRVQAREVDLHVHHMVQVWLSAQQLTIACYFSESPNQSKAIAAEREFVLTRRTGRHPCLLRR